MKICDLTCLYYPHGGGIKTYINNKRIVYKKRNISHVLIAPNWENPGKLEKIQDGSLTLYLVPAFKVRLLGTPYVIFKGFKKVTKILKEEKPDIIEIGDKITTLLFKRSIKKLHKYWSVKICAFSHERADNFSKTVLGNKFLGYIFSTIFIKRFIKSVDYIVSNSDFTAEEILKYLPKEKIFVIKLGINIKNFDRKKYYDQKLYDELSEKSKKILLVHVGRLDKDKKTGLLVDFAKKLDEKKYKLVIVGGGGYERDIKKIPAVKFIGWIDHEEVKKYLTVCQLGILVNDIEPYGLVGLEMMASGLAVLGPNKGGLISFLKKDFAWMLPYNKDAYLEALAQWDSLSTKEKQQKQDLAILEVQHYSLDRMTDQLIEVYEKNA